jgi:dTMP kinase
MAAGCFITFEGGEGAGKSTQIRLLADRLRAEGRSVVLTREPGGSAGAESIRALLLTGTTDRWLPLTEALLLAAARFEHLERTIRPALLAGQVVLCDRFADSTCAYQGAGHGVPDTALAVLHQLAVGDLRPDLTLILDLPAESGLARTVHRPGNEDRYERMDLAFHQRLRERFLRIAEAEPGRCRVIDADQDIAVVQAAILAAVRDRLGPAMSGADG